MDNMNEKDKYILNAYIELIGNYADDIRNNRRRAINVVEDLFARYKAENYFVVAAIKEGILEDLLDVGSLNDTEKNIRVGQAKLNASQALGFNYDIVSSMIDLFIIATGTDAKLSIDDPLEGLSEVERRLYLLRDVNIYLYSESADFTEKQLELLNSGFIECHEVSARIEIKDILRKLSLNIDDLWSIFDISALSDTSFSVNMGTKIMGKPMLLEIKVNCGGYDARTSYDSQISLQDKDGKLYTDRIYFEESLIEHLFGLDSFKEAQELLDKCKKNSKQNYIDSSKKEFQILLNLLPNEEILGDLSESIYSTYCDRLSAGFTWKNKDIYPEIEQFIISISKAAPLWEQVVENADSYRASGTFVARIGKLGVIAELSFSHKQGSSGIMKVVYKVVKPGSFDYIVNDFEGKLAKQFYETIKKSCRNYTFSKTISECVKKANVRIENEYWAREKKISDIIDLNSNINSALADEMRIVWNYDICDVKIANESIFDPKSLFDATHNKSIFWSRYEKNYGLEKYVTCFGGAFIVLTINTHTNINGRTDRNGYLYLVEGTNLKSKTAINSRQFLDAVISSRVELKARIAEDEEAIKKENISFIISETNKRDSKALRHIKKKKHVKFSVVDFFNKKIEKDINSTLYDLYYADETLFKKITQCHDVPNKLIEFVSCNKKMDPFVALLRFLIESGSEITDEILLVLIDDVEYQGFVDEIINHMIKFNSKFTDAFLVGLTKKEIILWGDKEGRWEENNKRVNKYKAYYNDTCIAAIDDIDMSEELLNLIKLIKKK